MTDWHKLTAPEKGVGWYRRIERAIYYVLFTLEHVLTDDKWMKNSHKFSFDVGGRIKEMINKTNQFKYLRFKTA